MQRIIRKITQEQFIQVTEHHNAKGIFTPQECQGYGVYGERYYEKDGEYFVSFMIGNSCD